MKRREALSLLVAASLPACGSSEDVADWTEEVQLHDGIVVKVSREARAFSSGFPVSRRGPNISFALGYEPMKVRWTGPANRPPLAFEIFDGVPYLVLGILDPESCAAKAPSDFAAQFVRYERGNWLDVPQDKFPVEVALKNLFETFWGSSADGDPKGLVSWSQKAQVDGFDPKHPYTIESFFKKYTNRRCEYIHR